jgi:AAHS family 4-hydroxybenzoate transporter-like MFS transporter
MIVIIRKPTHRDYFDNSDKVEIFQTREDLLRRALSSKHQDIRILMARKDELLSISSYLDLESPPHSVPSIVHPLDGRAPRQEVDVGEVIDALPFSATHVALTALCAAVALLDGYDTLAIAYAAPAIAEQWHMDARLFGAIFAAHGVGGVMGGATIGMFADHKGRRAALVGATALFGLAALATAASTTFMQLLIWRLVTGAGLAGALANAISLVSEYSPTRIRTSVVSIMFCAFPLGGALGGVLSAKLIQAWGWPAVFWVGGALPIALGFLLAIVLPESTKFLIARGADRGVIAAVLNRWTRTKVFQGDEIFSLPEEATRRSSVRELLSRTYALKTLALWISFAINQMGLTFAITWMPLVLRKAGVSLDNAIFASALFTLVGIFGAIVIARLTDRTKSGGTVVWAYFLSAAAIGSIGYAWSTIWLLFIAVSAAGFLIVGVAVNLNPIAASVYPTTIRSTGVGWSLAMKSVGGIAGALAGGVLVSSRLGLSSLYLIAAAPIVLGAVSFACLVFRSARFSRALKPN